MFGVDQESVLVYQEAVLVKRTVSRNHHQIQMSSSSSSKTYVTSSSTTTTAARPPMTAAANETTARARDAFQFPRSAASSAQWRSKATSTALHSPYSQQLYHLKVTYSSAPQKSTSERVSCAPPPPPLKQLKSYSVGSQLALYNVSGSHQPSSAAASFAPHSPLTHNNRQRQRNFCALSNNRRLPCRTTEDIIKSTRLPNGYELSQDLLDKQVEVLERKYGGQSRAGHAALTIQRAFRRYCMVRKFEDITNAKSAEKRLSRRFNGSESNAGGGSTSPTSSMAPAQENMAPSRAHYQPNCTALCHELNETLESTAVTAAARPPRPVRSLSLREKRQSSPISSLSSSSDASSIRSGRLKSASNLDEDGSGLLANNSESEYSDAGGGLAEDSTASTYCSAAMAPTHLSFVPHNHYVRPSAISPLITHALEMSPFSPTDIDSGMCGDRLLEHMLLGPSLDSSRRNSAPQTHCDAANKKKIPPEIPKRVSSISSCRSGAAGHADKCNGGDLLRSPDAGSLSSVQSSGSESSLTGGSGSDRATPAGKQITDDSFHNNKHSDATNSLISADHYHHSLLAEEKRLSNISENSEDSFEGSGYCSSLLNSSGFRVPLMRTPCTTPLPPGSQGYYKVSEVVRKRQYRVGLNLFNKKPEKGILYLIQRAFLENTPQTVARFLISRKGLSKQMIGEYMGNLQNPFNMEVLECFANEIDLAGLQVDVALRKFQTYFRMPGEAQKIERLVEVFSSRYCDCNRDIVSRFHSADTIFILAFAIIMLNTDLHTPNMKPEKRMKAEDFVRNLRGVDDGLDIELNMLLGIYERIKANEFRPGSDHVTQVMKVQQTIVGKKPTLALPHRRLVCYCRLYEVQDVHKKERAGVHQREVFLFNDLLVVTKIFSKKKNGVTYTFRQSFPLCGLQVAVFEAPHYPHGIRLLQKVDGKVAITFNARNEHDRSKFVEDLKESILEMDEMENLRIECELEKQKMVRNRSSENRDSGVADMELSSMNGNAAAGNATGTAAEMNHNGVENGGDTLHRIIGSNLKRSALSNSLLDIHETEKPQRRGSAGSLDSGMSVSFQSSAASLGSRDSSPHQQQQQQQTHANGKVCTGPKSMKLSSATSSASSLSTNPSFLGGLFGKKGRNQSRSNVKVNSASSAAEATEV